MTPDELKKWREDHKISPEELAEILGVHLATIYRWEGGDRTIPPYLELALETVGQKRKTARALDRFAIGE